MPSFRHVLVSKAEFVLYNTLQLAMGLIDIDELSYIRFLGPPLGRNWRRR